MPLRFSFGISLVNFCQHDGKVFFIFYVYIQNKKYRHFSTDCTGLFSGSFPHAYLDEFICCKYEDDPDERGCMDPIAINYMDCCPGNNYPGCVPNIPSNEQCCEYEIRGGETKHCTCCKKMENGTIQGFSMNTPIPIGDSCSQFNNSQPGLYGCVDTNLWSLSKCKQLPSGTVDESIIKILKIRAGIIK